MKLPSQQEEQLAMLQFLEGYLTEHRKEIFDRILSWRTNYITVAIEDLTDERNASAIIRTAECLGLQHAHVIRTDQDQKFKLYKGILKGAGKWIDVYSYIRHDDNTQTCIDTLKNQGYEIVATSPHKEGVLLEDFSLKQPAAFFFGTEQQGLSEKIFSQADRFLKVPIYGFTESYNVSVSAAIILHTLLEKLRKSDLPWPLTEQQVLLKRLEWSVKSTRNARMLLKKFFNWDL